MMNHATRCHDVSLLKLTDRIMIIDPVQLMRSAAAQTSRTGPVVGNVEKSQ
jgi:hypothetical protein